MTEKVKFLLEQLNKKEYRAKREHAERFIYDNEKSFAENFRCVIENEKPVLYEQDDFGFNRSSDHIVVPQGGNVTPNYARIINCGYDKVIEQLKEAMSKTNDKEKLEYGQLMLDSVEIVLEFADKYRDFAKEQGNDRLYNALCKIPHKGAETFYEACVFMKMCQYFLRNSFCAHMTLGRFDQYMYPFYLHDKANGVTDEELFETLEEFFISLNIDGDIYFGVQTGDNGQSMVLGGFDGEGNSMYNELSRMCMEASLELKLIDPKINLRVGKNTPDELYEFATHLTKAGLGFPQYCNDDVVVDGLVKLGYDREDALNYTVAACWEYIIPNCGADIPNCGVMDFPYIVNRVIMENLQKCNTFDELLKATEAAIKVRCDEIAEYFASHVEAKKPLLSVFLDGCIESLTDMWDGTKYNNYGCHGAGIANASDALAAVKKNVYDEKNIAKEDLLNALENNFEGYSELRNLLAESPKMGNNDDYVDDIAIFLMDTFSKNLNNRKCGIRRTMRAGTGSAQEYMWRGEQCGATADGRYAGEPYSSSFSPSLNAKTEGLLSVIQSFTKYDLTNIINGGPLTIEIHDTVLRNDMGIKKTAMLVKEYINRGGHQLQLNSINRDRLIDAQKHPEKYPNLIVRVWGWSGYFNELELKFQNHIIQRTEYGV